MNIFKLLKKNKLFYNFEDKEINQIFDCLHAHINKYSRGRVVAEIGNPVEEIGILLNGAAVKFVKKPNGELENCGELLEDCECDDQWLSKEDISQPFSLEELILLDEIDEDFDND